VYGLFVLPVRMLACRSDNTKCSRGRELRHCQPLSAARGDSRAAPLSRPMAVLANHSAGKLRLLCLHGYTQVHGVSSACSSKVCLLCQDIYAFHHDHGPFTVLVIAATLPVARIASWDTGWCRFLFQTGLLAQSTQEPLRVLLRRCALSSGSAGLRVGL
jgi:hypothetical protein